MKLFISFLLIFYAFLFLSSSQSHAAILFSDTFNGNGEISSYNPKYKHLDGFPGGGIIGGKIYIATDHLVVTEYDSAYLYNDFVGQDICASIDFNWSNGGEWTNIILNSTVLEWNDGIQVRKDSGNTSWVFYKARLPVASGSIFFDPNATHTLKACKEGSVIKGYLDNQLFFEGHGTSVNGYVGFASQIGTQYLDNFKIDGNITQNIGLDVPLLKQSSLPWKTHVYNSANLWNPSDPTINAWGCALTSAAMVFKYNGINKLPDSTNVDPGTLNNWLKKQKDGYVGNGNLNWLALTRLSRLSKNINGLSFNALEYTRINGNNHNKLTEALNNNRPGILRVPGHFIVAKGASGNSFAINDPYYTREFK